VMAVIENKQNVEEIIGAPLHFVMVG